MVSRQVLCVPKILELEAHGLPKLYPWTDLEDGLATPLPHVDVDRTMVVAVEEETEAILGEDRGHSFEV